MASRAGVHLAEASGIAVAFRESWQRGLVPRDPRDRMAFEHEQQQQQYQRDLVRLETRRHRLRRAFKWGTGTAVVAGSAAASDLISLLGTGNGLDVWFWLGAPVAVLSAMVARSSSKSVNQLEPPQPPTAPPPPPLPLPKGALGATESMRLHTVRVHLAQLIPTISGLHEEAAAELRRADFEAAPALAALVERLFVIYHVSAGMVGTGAAVTAQTSGEEIRRRLAEGVSMYEDLLNAALQMLSVPDPLSAPNARLELTVRELISYSEGLRVAANTPKLA